MHLRFEFNGPVNCGRRDIQSRMEISRNAPSKKRDRIKLVSGIIFCDVVAVADRLRSFIAVLMAILALGFGTPVPSCAATHLTPTSSCSCCCCSEFSAKYAPKVPCKQSCSLVYVQGADKQLPARPATEPTAKSQLFAFAPVEITYPTVLSVLRIRSINFSPPFGSSSPPQAVLRLWQI